MSRARDPARQPALVRSPRTFDLNRNIRETTKHFRDYAGTNAIISTSLAAPLPLFHGFSDTIERATTALLCYSLRCLNKQPGIIGIKTGIRYFPSVEHPGTYTFLEIFDTGASVDQRIRRQTIKDSESVLVAVMNAVKEHDGDIDIQPVHDGYLTTLLLSAERNISGKRPRDDP